MMFNEREMKIIESNMKVLMIMQDELDKMAHVLYKCTQTGELRPAIELLTEMGYLDEDGEWAE